MYTEHLLIPAGPGRLHVERTGRGGPPVVLLHGFGTSAFQWRGIAPALAESGYAVLAPDLLGFGASDQPAEAAAGPGAQAGYVAEALRALRLGPAHVVGQGFGALVALLLAAQHPDRVERVGLIDPLDPQDLPGPLIRALQRAGARATLTGSGLFVARPLFDLLFDATLPPAWSDTDRLRARYLAPFVGRDGLAMLLRLTAAVSLTASEQRDLPGVRAAVQAWVGQSDPPRTAHLLATWHAQLPLAAVSVTETGWPAGELVCETAPEDVLAALRAWLA